jgi:hypothetical protein
MVLASIEKTSKARLSKEHIVNTVRMNTDFSFQKPFAFTSYNSFTQPLQNISNPQRQTPSGSGVPIWFFTASNVAHFAGHVSTLMYTLKTSVLPVSP